MGQSCSASSRRRAAEGNVTCGLDNHFRIPLHTCTSVLAVGRGVATCLCSQCSMRAVDKSISKEARVDESEQWCVYTQAWASLLSCALRGPGLGWLGGCFWRAKAGSLRRTGLAVALPLRVRTARRVRARASAWCLAVSACPSPSGSSGTSADASAVAGWRRGHCSEGYLGWQGEDDAKHGLARRHVAH